MSTLVVLGAQWGDEGKGKLVDYLAAESDCVARFQGGHNAGHTIKVNDQTIALHLVPSGALHKRVVCVLGNGVVLSPAALLKEMDALSKHGIDLSGRLWISEASPILLASHQSLDMAREKKANADAIGTTGRGIGPAYEDKVARRGLRWGDLWRDDWRARVRDLMDYHNFMLNDYYKEQTVDTASVLATCEQARKRFDGLVEDVGQRLRQMRKAGQHIMLEGAQGVALDIDHGTYPFVTSSNTTVGAAAVGSGLGVHDLDKVIGISKAYTTRVGAGPMPTELFDEQGAHLCERGQEIGTTTGRTRRCGWLDAAHLRDMVSLNSMDALCLTKLDVLDQLDEIPVCVEYRHDADGCEPVYKCLQGWSTPISGINQWNDLPKQAMRFVEQIEEWAGVPIALISVGPERDQTIMRRDSLWKS